MKKKVIIIIGIVSVALAIGGTIYFLNSKSKSSDENKNNNNNVNETIIDENNDLEVLSSIEKALGDTKPTLIDFNVDIDGELKIYFNDTIYEEDTLNKIGTYEVVITVDDKEYNSKIVVSDKEAPTLKLKDIKIKEGSSYKLKDFVESCNDNSKEDCDLAFVKSEMSKYTKAGNYDIEIKATDKSGNEKIKKAKLTISENKTTSENTNNNQNNSTNNNSQNTSTTNNNQNNNANNNTTNNNTSKDKITEAGKLVNSNSSQVNAVIAETNKIREELGLAPLTYSASLTKAAMYRALEISESGVSHTRPDGTKFSTVFKELGISYTSVGENLAAGRSNATTTVNDWKGSSGHYANIVDTKFTKIGVGYVYVPGLQYKYYWVQLFSN
ncbi:MAG: CAP domain-containing protein [Ruminococcus sp.]|nr:CAP domain-containing protein [Ruminococcus sp.]